VLIDALRPRSGTGALTRLIRDWSVGFTAISLFELERGARSAQELVAIRALLRELEFIPIDLRAAVEAGAIERELRASGQALEIRDTLIAGVARSGHVTLVTRNARHFDRVQGLTVEDPHNS
jgi:predicted nucleic acid-binding protein